MDIFPSHGIIFPCAMYPSPPPPSSVTIYYHMCGSRSGTYCPPSVWCQLHHHQATVPSPSIIFSSASDPSFAHSQQQQQPSRDTSLAWSLMHRECEGIAPCVMYCSLSRSSDLGGMGSERLWQVLISESILREYVWNLSEHGLIQ